MLSVLQTLWNSLLVHFSWGSLYLGIISKVMESFSMFYSSSLIFISRPCWGHRGPHTHRETLSKSGILIVLWWLLLGGDKIQFLVKSWEWTFTVCEGRAHTRFTIEVHLTYSPQKGHPRVPPSLDHFPPLKEMPQVLYAMLTSMLSVRDH